MFRQAAGGAYDAVVALYHDQGLIPLKLLHFDDGVNLTLGLPFVRTSPDHGTAYDIAGTGARAPRASWPRSISAARTMRYDAAMRIALALLAVVASCTTVRHAMARVFPELKWRASPATERTSTRWTTTA